MTYVGSIYFALCALVCLVGALVTVLARNPIRGAIGLLSCILGIAGLFLALHAQFLATIQLIVYAGAVVVLFVFVIMLLGADARDPNDASSTQGTRVVSGVLWGAITVAACLLTLGSLQGKGALRLPPVAPGHGSIESLSRLLFSEALVPFELSTALLMVAVVGAIAVSRSSRRQKPQSSIESNATRRMFFGPVHPRDAEHPITKEVSR